MSNYELMKVDEVPENEDTLTKLMNPNKIKR